MINNLNDLNLIYKNDKKEKWQSHEVRLEIEEIFNQDIIGYGINKEQALEEFKCNLATHIIAVEEHLNKIKRLYCNIRIEDLKE